jgi:RNA polymerase sigma-70 factor (ECF subfamily)
MRGATLSELTRQAQAGDPVACRALWSELHGAVRKRVRLLLGAGAIADDAVQDTMIALHRGLAGFRGAASPRTWALAIATRIARRLRRKEARYQLVEDGTVDLGVLDRAPVAAAELATLKPAFTALTEDQREVLILMAVFGLSAEETGRTLGTLASTAASRYRRARAELETRLRSVEPPPLAALVGPGPRRARGAALAR